MKRTAIHSFLFSVTVLLLAGCGSNTRTDIDDIPPAERGVTLSISCSETDGEIENNVLVAHCYVHAVDGNSDPISGLTYDVSLANHIKVDRGGTGTILSTEPISFSDNGVNFSQEDVRVSDHLIIFPTANTYAPSYLGNWKISAINKSTLTLRDIAYNLETTEDLRYIIGSSVGAHIEEPQDGASPDDGGDTVNDPEGLYYFDLIYDPSLRGTSMAIGVHTTEGNRVGTATVIVLEAASTTP